MKIQSLVEDLIGKDLPIGIRAYDGTLMGPVDPPASLVINSRNALRRIITRPGELGFARSYVAGDVDIEGDIFDFMDLQARLPKVKLTYKQVIKAIQILGIQNLRPMTPPPEELRKRWGLRHSRKRDAAAIAHHYDVSNEFYRLLLGPSMTYSCAIFESEDDSLEQAQSNKYELVCRKLALKPGDRLLDIGCGWGGMAVHAAKYHAVKVVGITVSRNQVEYAQQLVKDQGLDGQVAIRLQDYRDINDGPFDAVCSIGMFEHAGLTKRCGYFAKIHALLCVGGRLLNHAISRKPSLKESLPHSGFVDRYVFPDGEAIEVGKVMSAIQKAGFEARQMDSMREHYALTTRRWVKNLEKNWDQAVALSSLGKAKVWRFYLAGASTRFAWNLLHVNQILAIKNIDGPSATPMPLRPSWDGPLRI